MKAILKRLELPTLEQIITSGFYDSSKRPPFCSQANPVEMSTRQSYVRANLSTGSTVVIEDSCFIDNDFTGFGVVRAWDGSGITLSGNAVEGFDDDLLCQFVAKLADNPYQSSEVTCIESELAFCPF
jgi:hypothetical protein